MEELPSRRSEYSQGLTNGIPIFFGYFPAAMAFGLLAASFHLTVYEALLFSVTNFAGASQFMAVSLVGSGTAVAEIAIAVLLINLRYFLMSASLVRRLPPMSMPMRAVLAFGNTDEVFSVASLRTGPLTSSFVLGLSTIAYLGWVSGTACGFLAGAFLPLGVRAVLGGTLYALFAALLAPEFKKGLQVIFTAAFAAILNTAALKVFLFSPGWSLVFAIAIATLAGTFIKGAPCKKA